MAMTGPTERSNSPAIINCVTPMAMMPVSVAALTMPAIERSVKKLGTKSAKSTKTAISVTPGPKAGERKSAARGRLRCRTGVDCVAAVKVSVSC